MVGRRKRGTIRQRRSVYERIFNVANILFMVVLSVTIILPFLQQITYSLSTQQEADRQGLHLVPNFANITFDSYRRILTSGHIMRGLGYTMFRTVVGTVLT